MFICEVDEILTGQPLKSKSSQPRLINGMEDKPYIVNYFGIAFPKNKSVVLTHLRICSSSPTKKKKKPIIFQKPHQRATHPPHIKYIIASWIWIH